MPYTWKKKGGNNGMKLTNERIQANKGKIIDLLLSTKREGIEKLVEWLKTTDFFTSPASVNFHLNIKGGLVQHSLNVYNAYRLLYYRFVNGDMEEELDTAIITALLHDLCKYDLYKENNELGYTYRYPQPPKHGSRSVELTKKFISLTKKEEMMIRYHMSHWDEKEGYDLIKNTLSKDCPEAHLLYFADHIASLYLDTKVE